MRPFAKQHKRGAFAKLVLQPGGATMEEAVRAAEANLASIHGMLVVEVEAALERVQTLGETLRDEPDGRALDRLYEEANALIGITGGPGLRALNQVCYSLCELIDRLQASRVGNAPAVRIHLDSLRLLRPGTAEGEAEQDAMVSALRRVVQRI
jgi:hypothetical protein